MRRELPLHLPRTFHNPRKPVRPSVSPSSGGEEVSSSSLHQELLTPANTKSPTLKKMRHSTNLTTKPGSRTHAIPPLSTTTKSNVSQKPWDCSINIAPPNRDHSKFRKIHNTKHIRNNAKAMILSWRLDPGDNSERDGESQSERERETSGATEETRLPQVAPAAKLRDAALPLAASHESHDLRGLTAYPRTTLPPNFERPQRSVGGETLD
jgi:hypothetical protein